MDVSMSRCGLPTGLVWLSERKQSPNKSFQGDTLRSSKNLSEPILGVKKNIFYTFFYSYALNPHAYIHIYIAILISTTTKSNLNFHHSKLKSDSFCCQAQIRLVSIAKLSWVITIIALHNHHHPTTGKVSKHHLQSSQEHLAGNLHSNPLEDSWYKINILNPSHPPSSKNNNNNLSDQPNTAQLNLSSAWHSSAPACINYLSGNKS